MRTPRRLGAAKVVVPTFVAALGAAAIVVAGACKDPPTVDERIAQRIVVTKFDPNADFTSFATFALPDSILFLRALDGGATEQSQVETLDPAIASRILQEIASQLRSRGYTQITRTDGPDLGVAVTAVARLRTETVQYGEWSDQGSANPGFWGYPGVAVVAPFAYATFAWVGGTLIIELEDLRAARGQAAAPLLSLTVMPAATAPDAGVQPSATVTVAWAALIHGVVSAEVIAAPPVESIQQAFAQSPYLRR